MSETREQREAFIEKYQICSSRGWYYGRDQLVGYIRRSRMGKLFRITRTEIDAVLDPIVKIEAGCVPARIADTVIHEIIDQRARARARQGLRKNPTTTSTP